MSKELEKSLNDRVRFFGKTKMDNQNKAIPSIVDHTYFCPFFLSAVSFGYLCITYISHLAICCY